MTIEEAIQQKKFASPIQKAMVNIVYSGNWMNLQHTQLLKPYGISTQQFNILRILRGQHPKPASVNLLIDRMLDKMSNVSRLVEKLRQKGLVERSTCQKDRRQVDVIITKEGIEHLENVSASFDTFQRQFAHLSHEEAELLNELLDKLRTPNN